MIQLCSLYRKLQVARPIACVIIMRYLFKSENAIVYPVGNICTLFAATSVNDF